MDICSFWLNAAFAHWSTPYVLRVLWGLCIWYPTLTHILCHSDSTEVSAAMLLWTWKPSIMNKSGGERSSSLFSLNSDCIINRSDWSSESHKHNSLWIQGKVFFLFNSLLFCSVRCRQTENRVIIIQSNIHVHTFDSHKRLWACGYLINMTGLWM